MNVKIRPGFDFIVRLSVAVGLVVAIFLLVIALLKINKLGYEKNQIKQELTDQEFINLQLSGELNKTIDETESLINEIVKLESEIDDLNSEMTDLISSNVALGAAIETLEEENEELKQITQYSFNGKWKYDYSEEDLDILAGVMYGENWISGRWEMMLTGSVVLNRVISKDFPNTIKEVVYQIDGGYEQYAPRTKNLIRSKEVPHECYELAKLLLKYGPICPKQVLYQAHKNQGNVYWEYNGEEFCYKEDIDNEAND